MFHVEQCQVLEYQHQTAPDFHRKQICHQCQLCDEENMKKILFLWVGLSISCTTFCGAFNPPDQSLTLTTDSRTLTISTTPTSPTLLLTKDSWIQRNFIINNSSFTLFLGTTSTSVSTNTAFGIPGYFGTNNSLIFSPDGVNAPWGGALYGVLLSSQPESVSIFRSK